MIILNRFGSFWTSRFPIQDQKKIVLNQIQLCGCTGVNFLNWNSMQVIKPVVTRNTSLKIETNQRLWPLWDTSNYQDSDAEIRLLPPVKSSFTSLKQSVENAMDEIQTKLKKRESDCRNDRKIIVF